MEALYEDTGMRTCSIEGTHAIRALLSFYDRLNLKTFENDQKAFESVHGRLPDEERRKRRKIFEEESTFSNTLSSSIRLKLWNTKPALER